MLWFYLTTFFAIAKIWGGLTFSWWWISLMVFLDLFQFVVDSVISYSVNNNEDINANDEISDEIINEFQEWLKSKESKKENKE